MKESGCCGADEFIKLHAYTLTEYHRVVHLDMDSIIYKNMVSQSVPVTYFCFSFAPDFQMYAHKSDAYTCGIHKYMHVYIHA
jgi:alpha-N-acetylglucosamine transferase